jgi:hypothetical protein
LILLTFFNSEGPGRGWCRAEWRRYPLLAEIAGGDALKIDSVHGYVAVGVCRQREQLIE